MGIFDKIKKLFKKEDKDKLEKEKLEKESLIKQLDSMCIAPYFQILYTL